MNKKLFFIPLAVLGMASCTNDAPGIDQNGVTDVESGNYLSVNIVYPNLNTRVDGTTDGGYEAGTPDENQVNNIRFYFFDASGNAKAVSGEKNYIDKTPEDFEDNKFPTQKPDQSTTNVEKIVGTMLVLDTRDGNTMALKMLAVLNVPKTVLGETNLSVSELQGKIADYSHTSSNSNAKGFIMTNSVYADGGKEVVATEIPRLYFTAEDATDNPVDIYVERVEAKVRLTMGLEGVNGGTFKAMRKVEGSEDQSLKLDDGSEIYVKFLGWNVTTRANKSYLVKNFEEGWLTSDPFTNWNKLSDYRSFWALNPAGIEYQYGSFNKKDDLNAVLAYKYGYETAEAEFKSDNVYVQENAADNVTKKDLVENNRTKVIIGAKLVDKDGKELMIGEVGGIRYKIPVEGSNANYTAFLGTALRYLKNVYYKKNADNSYTEIAPADVKLVDARTMNGGEINTIEDGKRCFTYMQLGSEDETWYVKSDNGYEETEDNVNEELASISLKIWTNGNTYYYFDITHLNGNAVEDEDGNYEGSGKYGVVRNHIYSTSVTGFYGIGTPVYDETEEIIPEKPKSDDSMVAANINVLSWKVVNQSTTLEW